MEGLEQFLKNGREGFGFVGHKNSGRIQFIKISLLSKDSKDN